MGYYTCGSGDSRGIRHDHVCRVWVWPGGSISSAAEDTMDAVVERRGCGQSMHPRRKSARGVGLEDMLKLRSARDDGVRDPRRVQNSRPSIAIAVVAAVCSASTATLATKASSCSSSTTSDTATLASPAIRPLNARLH